MLSNDKNHELFSIVKLMKKGVANGDIVDEYGHTIKSGQKYFKGRYMENIEEKKCFTRYKVLEDKVLYIRPKELHTAFVDINPSTLVMPKQEYVSLLQNNWLILELK